MFSAKNIHFDVAKRTRGPGCGGIGAMHPLARQSGLAKAIDYALHLLKVHKPYHESDHVPNIACNILAGGDCLDDLELLRNDEVYLDAQGAQRIPDPTTADQVWVGFACLSSNRAHWLPSPLRRRNPSSGPAPVASPRTQPPHVSTRAFRRPAAAGEVSRGGLSGTPSPARPTGGPAAVAVDSPLYTPKLL